MTLGTLIHHLRFPLRLVLPRPLLERHSQPAHPLHRQARGRHSRLPQLVPLALLRGLQKQSGSAPEIFYRHVRV